MSVRHELCHMTSPLFAIWLSTISKTHFVYNQKVPTTIGNTNNGLNCLIFQLVVIKQLSSLHNSTIYPFPRTTIQQQMTTNILEISLNKLLTMCMFSFAEVSERVYMWGRVKRRNSHHCQWQCQTR